MAYIGTKPADKPLTSADITDGIITTTKIADSNITSAKITDATIVNGDIANATIALAKLSATGTPSASTFLRGDNSWGSAGAAAGQVIQVLGATDSTQRITSSTSYVTASNTLSVTITPSSASNKILIISNFNVYVEASTTGHYTIFRDSTNLGVANGMSNLSIETYVGTSVSYLDSPNTTSAITYQIYLKKSGAGSNYFNVNSTTSSITCLEIKG